MLLPGGLPSSLKDTHFTLLINELQSLHLCRIPFFYFFSFFYIFDVYFVSCNLFAACRVVLILYGVYNTLFCFENPSPEVFLLIRIYTIYYI